jgi:hypothetical protein
MLRTAPSNPAASNELDALQSTRLPESSMHEGDLGAMTALIGAAVLGLVPLPSVGSPNAPDRRRDPRPASNETAADSYRQRHLQAFVANMVLRREFASERRDARRHKS